MHNALQVTPAGNVAVPAQQRDVTGHFIRPDGNHIKAVHKISNRKPNNMRLRGKQLDAINAAIKSGGDVNAAIQKTCEAVSNPSHVSDRPKIVCICGSSRFVDVSAVKAWELNKQGIATFFMPLLPQWYPGVKEHHQAEAEGVAENLDTLWLKLIEAADSVFVVNVGGYIGSRTRIEIEHAKSLGRPVEYLESLR